VFCYRDGRPMNRRHVLQVFHRLSARAKVGWKIHPHSLRHFCGVSVLKATGNLELVRQTLGHETLTMALHYSRLASVDVARAYRRASPVDALTLEQELQNGKVARLRLGAGTTVRPSSFHVIPLTRA